MKRSIIFSLVMSIVAFGTALSGGSYFLFWLSGIFLGMAIAAIMVRKAFQDAGYG